MSVTSFRVNSTDVSTEGSGELSSNRSRGKGVGEEGSG